MSVADDGSNKDESQSKFTKKRTIFVRSVEEKSGF